MHGWVRMTAALAALTPFRHAGCCGPLGTAYKPCPMMQSDLLTRLSVQGARHADISYTGAAAWQLAANLAAAAAAAAAASRPSVAATDPAHRLARQRTRRLAPAWPRPWRQPTAAGGAQQLAGLARCSQCTTAAAGVPCQTICMCGTCRLSGTHELLLQGQLCAQCAHPAAPVQPASCQGSLCMMADGSHPLQISEARSPQPPLPPPSPALAPPPSASEHRQASAAGSKRAVSSSVHKGSASAPVSKAPARLGPSYAASSCCRCHSCGGAVSGLLSLHQFLHLYAVAGQHSAAQVSSLLCW